MGLIGRFCGSYIESLDGKVCDLSMCTLQWHCITIRCRRGCTLELSRADTFRLLIYCLIS